MLLVVVRVRVTAVKLREGRWLERSMCGMNLMEGMPESPEEVSAAGWEVGRAAIVESIDVMPPVREGRRIVALRSSDAGVGPIPALEARLRFMPIVLRSGEADSEVDAGSKVSLFNPLRPWTVGSHPFSLFWMLSLRPSFCF